MAETGMVEKVARAIYERRSKRTDYVWPDDVYPAVRNRCLSDARAAIEAMRNLPEPVAENLSWHFTNDIVSGNGYQVKSLWSDAIDAILKEK